MRPLIVWGILMHRLFHNESGARAMWKLFLLSVFLACGFAVPSKADPIPMPPELHSFLMQPDQQKTVVGTMMQYWQAIMENCPSPKLTQTDLAIIQTPTFDGSGAPTSGAWRIIGHMEGCGASRVFNILQGVGQGGKFVTAGLLPGTTLADPTLQKDAIFYAMMGMSAIAPKGCKDVKITDTKFLQYGPEVPAAMPGRLNKMWDEEWTVRSCGVTGVVPMSFVPDATGTTIRSSVNGTRRVDP